jgi:hypothetical protein
VSGRAKALIAGAVAVLLMVPGVSWLLGIRKVDPGAEPFEVADAFPHHRFQSVLERFVAPEARRAKWTIEYVDYDWSLNQRE